MPRHVDIFVAMTPKGVFTLTRSTDRAEATEVTEFMKDISTGVLLTLSKKGIEAKVHDLEYESGDEGAFVLLPIEIVSGDLGEAVDIAAEWVGVPRAAKLLSGATPKVRLFVP